MCVLCSGLLPLLTLLQVKRYLCSMLQTTKCIAMHAASAEIVTTRIIPFPAGQALPAQHRPAGGGQAQQEVSGVLLGLAGRFSTVSRAELNRLVWKGCAPYSVCTRRQERSCAASCKESRKSVAGRAAVLTATASARPSPPQGRGIRCSAGRQR